MIIVCATDDNFVQHCSIMLVSLLSNNDNVTIFVLTEGLKLENEQIIREEVAAYNGEVQFCLVDGSIIGKFPMPKQEGLSHISRATYYRLLIPEILPIGIDKAIYLDCDIIINGCLKELWDLDISSYALAAVPQIGYGFEAKRLGYPIEYGYFNAGVNVINIKHWRENNVIKSLIDYIGSHYEIIKYHDQDTLNAVLFDQTFHLLPQWNMTSAIYVYDLKNRGDSYDGKIINLYKAEKENAWKFYKNPIIIHYVSKPKPWQKNCTHPLYNLYYKYARNTVNFKKITQQNYMSRFPYILFSTITDIGSAIKQKIKKSDLTRL